MDQAGHPGIVSGRGHPGPAGAWLGGAVHRRRGAAWFAATLAGRVDTHDGGGLVCQRRAVPAVRGGRAARCLRHRGDAQRHHPAVDRGDRPGHPPSAGDHGPAGGRACHRVRRSGADLLTLAGRIRAGFHRGDRMSRRGGELRGQLCLHGPVPGPSGHRPSRLVGVPARGGIGLAGDSPGRDRRPQSAARCHRRRQHPGPRPDRNRRRIRAELPDHRQRGRHRGVHGHLPAAGGRHHPGLPGPRRAHHAARPGRDRADPRRGGARTKARQAGTP